MKNQRGTAAESRETQMGNYMFGVSRTKPTRDQAKRMRRAAKKHDAELIETTLPGTGYQRWFTTRNWGAPFDQATAKAVMLEVEQILDKQ